RTAGAMSWVSCPPIRMCAAKHRDLRPNAEPRVQRPFNSPLTGDMPLATIEERPMSKYTEVLTPQNSQIIFIDQQPQMAFGVQSIDRQTLKNNVVGLAKAAKAFGIPAVITTVETESFSGHTYPELLAVFPDIPLLERTSMNSWDDQKVR